MIVVPGTSHIYIKNSQVFISQNNICFQVSYFFSCKLLDMCYPRMNIIDFLIIRPILSGDNAGI